MGEVNMKMDKEVLAKIQDAWDQTKRDPSISRYDASWLFIQELEKRELSLAMRQKGFVVIDTNGRVFELPRNTNLSGGITINMACFYAPEIPSVEEIFSMRAMISKSGKASKKAEFEFRQKEIAKSSLRKRRFLAKERKQEVSMIPWWKKLLMTRREKWALKNTDGPYRYHREFVENRVRFFKLMNTRGNTKLYDDSVLEKHFRQNADESIKAVGRDSSQGSSSRELMDQEKRLEFLRQIRTQQKLRENDREIWL